MEQERKGEAAAGAFPVAHYRQSSHAGSASPPSASSSVYETRASHVSPSRLHPHLSLVSSPEVAREFLKTHDQLFRKQLYSNEVQYSYNKILL